MILEKSCHEFVASLASKAAVPGGGGAAAYVGALGTALGSMVANLSIGKKKYAAFEPELREALDRSTALIIHLEELVEADATAFLPLSKAYGMPKATKEERQAKEQAIQTASVGAAKAPLEIAQACLESLSLLALFAEKGSRLALSDAGCGALFAKAAIQAAQLNVLINTKSLKDVTVKEEIEKELEQVVATGVKQADAIYQSVLQSLQS